MHLTRSQTTSTHMRRFLLNALGVLPLLGKPPPNAKEWAGVLRKTASAQPANFRGKIWHKAEKRLNINRAVYTISDLFIERMLVSTSQSLRLPLDTTDATTAAPCGSVSCASALAPFFELPLPLSCDRLRLCGAD